MHLAVCFAERGKPVVPETGFLFFCRRMTAKTCAEHSRSVREDLIWKLGVLAWSLKGLSIEGHNERRLETLVDSKSCGCTRNFLVGKEEVTGSILVEGSSFLNRKGLYHLILFGLSTLRSLK
jgi:hypothetical protein